jgi:hypothetical protein
MRKTKKLCPYCLQYKKTRACNECGLFMCIDCFIDFEKKPLCLSCFCDMMPKIIIEKNAKKYEYPQEVD